MLISCELGDVWMVPDLLTCWTGLCGKKAYREIWGAIPSCLMWTFRRERNMPTFEGKACLIIQLKSQFLGTPYVMPQILISVCTLSPTSGIYWVELGFINNCKEPQL